MVMIEHSYGGDINIEDKDLGGGKVCSTHVLMGCQIEPLSIVF
jgi:hypothetical protein